MASHRLALVVLLCLIVAVQSQSRQRSQSFRRRPAAKSTASTASETASTRSSLGRSRARGSSTGSRSSIGSSTGSNTGSSSARASAGRTSLSSSARGRTRSRGQSVSSSARASTKTGSRTSTNTGSRFGGSSSQSTFGRTSGSQSTFGRAGSTKPSFGRTGSSKPAFGSAGRSKPAFGRAGSSQSAFGRAGSNKPAFGSAGRSKPSFGRAKPRPTFGAGRTNSINSASSNRRVVTQSPKVNFNCPEEDGFFANQQQCDKYFQCKEGVASEQLCPDGLLFKSNVSYPCVFPQEVECLTRSGQQEAQPTEDCPRQYAIFKAADAGPADCGAFTKCVNGRAFQSICPATLAFNTRSLHCDWADEVDDCDAEGFLGFQCPAVEFGPSEVGKFTSEPHPDDCTKFFICINKEDGRVVPRLQGCPAPSVFDREKGECNENVEEVAGCENAIDANIVAAFRRRADDEQQRREGRLAELRSKLQG